MNDDVRQAVKEIVEHLTDGKYAELVDVSNGIRLSESEISTAVTEYGRTLIYPPNSAYHDVLDATLVDGSDPPKWLIDMPLWTKEEGRSDLTIRLGITRWPKACAVEIDGILVP